MVSGDLFCSVIILCFFGWPIIWQVSKNSLFFFKKRLQTLGLSIFCVLSLHFENSPSLGLQKHYLFVVEREEHRQKMRTGISGFGFLSKNGRFVTHTSFSKIMRCAKGIFAKGILGGTGFSLLRWEEGSETPSCGGKKGLRLPRSLGRSMRNEGVSDPFSHRKKESQTLLPTAKGKTPVPSQSP